MASSRLPGKVLRDICGQKMIDVLLSRLKLCSDLSQIVVATSISDSDQPLVNHLQLIGQPFYRGSEHNVLQRYLAAAEAFDADVIVRITGDCPLIDPLIVSQTIQEFQKQGVEYLSNTNPPTFPDGLDVEVFTLTCLKKSESSDTSSFNTEHVTPFMRTSAAIRRGNFSWTQDLSDFRWTVDEMVDLEVVRNIVSHFVPRLDFGWLEIVELQQTQPQLFKSNREILRNEGANMNEGQKLWKRAKNIIPGGNMLLSKRSEMFLPNFWPSYFSKAKGCEVWDLDGNRFVDMSIMGIGTNILGYGHDEVDRVVRNVVNSGNMSTLNCPEEVYLAEELVAMHPWADMVRFARSGGEANAIAIRIARAATGKSTVAFCGYHGWHDWYLSANLGDESKLAGHLLPGLQPNGVPAELAGTAIPFEYNQIDQLIAILDSHDVGVIKMEVIRNLAPDPGFLSEVRRLATEHGAVLIFDECTSGFRQSYGGIHKLFGVEPDMAMFGKALGNGYAITATIGRREIMEAAQSSFISSTFWTERIGPAAALKTLEVMKRIESWEIISDIGARVQAKWSILGKEHGINVVSSGLPALSNISFNEDDPAAYRTLMTQEMLKRGYLTSGNFYPSICHTSDVLEEYFANLDEVFRLISECKQSNAVTSHLNGPVAHSGFKRLN